MKKVTLILVALVAVLALTVAPAVAAPPTTVTVSWLEDATRYNPDGTVAGTWTDAGPFSMELLQTGKAYHVPDIAEFYQPTPEVEGSLAISGAGKLSGHATYTSLRSSLPIKERFKGNVTIGAGTLVGTYTQYAYAFGSQADVLAWYPNAVPQKSPQAAGWWFIGYTDYTAHQ